MYSVITKGKHRNIYHIGNNDEIKIVILAKKILNLCKKEAKIITSETPKGETFRRCPDIKKISKIGYKQKFSIDEGLKITINWYLKNLDLKRN